MDENEFWGMVAKGKECWKWKGKPNAAGYGRVFIAGKIEYAHRVAFLWLVGDVAPGQKLYNTCSNRLCVNPEHWQIEKPIHNGIQHYQRPKPAKRRYSRRREKVTPAQVQAIIENRDLTQTAIATRYRISQAQVSRIIAGRSRWRGRKENPLTVELAGLVGYGAEGALLCFRRHPRI